MADEGTFTRLEWPETCPHLVFWGHCILWWACLYEMASSTWSCILDGSLLDTSQPAWGDWLEPTGRTSISSLRRSAGCKFHREVEWFPKVIYWEYGLWLSANEIMLCVCLFVHLFWLYTCLCAAMCLIGLVMARDCVFGGTLFNFGCSRLLIIQTKNMLFLQVNRRESMV